MWSYNETPNELMHYGVLGMRWGVHRALRLLKESNASGDKAGHNRAVSTLSTHRDKITKKISKLNTKSEKLAKRKYKIDTKLEPKAAALERRALKLDKRATRARTDARFVKLIRKSVNLKTKASYVHNASAKVQKKIVENQKLKTTFAKGLKDINAELITNGQDFLYMQSNGVPYGA